MEEKNKHILAGALERLPQFKAGDRVWDKIEQELDHAGYEKNRHILKGSISKLPASVAGKNSWDQIEKALERNPGKSTRIYFLKIAASVIIIIGAGILINRGLDENTQNDRVTFSQEMIVNHAMDIASSGIEQELNDLIQRQCRIQPDICMNPVFTELNEELISLTRSLEEIKILSENPGNDPETYKYMLRIQKERAQISKKLLQFFNS